MFSKEQVGNAETVGNIGSEFADAAAAAAAFDTVAAMSFVREADCNLGS